ncbi:hypothetical protein CI109_101556 [Kwoniella shandongensis]|uniref:Uncharacterized protein n=1 Tax=Kwoniella shandongensis TaxID=1734106 RepID=A0A5M6C5V8_9TREE|nr:uncharacterized protein CI109_001312 [Kwoniella shandongensis]KAA5530508.1 hypothetical protein CI109_001312 [Kwoniella shandongensis]
MSHPSLPSPPELEMKENMFTLPPIRTITDIPPKNIHATPKPNPILPPTPHTQLRTDPNLITPIQARTRQPLGSVPMNQHGLGFSTNSTDPNVNVNVNAMMTPQTGPNNMNKNGHVLSSVGFEKDQVNSLTRHQTPCPRSSLALSTATRKQPNFHPTPDGTPDHHASKITPLKTPASALSTRTMGRSVSTPTLPVNSFPLGAYSQRSNQSTRYSPSSDSQRSTSVSRSGARENRRGMFSSPSPTPSSPPAINLAGIQPPAAFPGTYPTAYTRKDPVPTDDGDDVPEGKRSGRQGAPSWNPWDYVLGDLPGPDQPQTPMKDGDDGKGKIRRRFTKRELEALEVLWSIAKSPSKYERQRLGAWLGVKTKHITVWFQNRRQEEKRYLREGAPADPPPPSRSNRGTFDPVTGKWRPVPLSCISGLQPPPEEKSAVVRAISVGDITRDMYFAQYPHGEVQMSTPSSRSMSSATPLPKRGMSNSLDEVLQARESGFGGLRNSQFRRGSGDVMIKGEGQERIREILALMPSDPPSMDLSEMAVEDDSEEGDEDNDAEEPELKRKGGMGLAKMLNGPSTGLGRASSLDIFASSSRAKYLSKPNALQPRSMNGNGVLGSVNMNIPSDSRQTPKSSLKHGLASTHQQPQPAKRARIDTARPRPTSTLRHKDSFSRSQSAAVLDTPAKENRGDMMKTPGFTRSFSFSSTVSEGVAITPETAVLGKENVETTVRQPGRKRVEERDAEVLGAAEKLLQLLGGA